MVHRPFHLLSALGVVLLVWPALSPAGKEDGPTCLKLVENYVQEALDHPSPGLEALLSEGPRSVEEVRRHWEVLARIQGALQSPALVQSAAAVAGVKLAAYDRGYESVRGGPSGDLYRVTPLVDGRLSLFLGDAKGHDQAAVRHSVRMLSYLTEEKVAELHGGGASASEVLGRVDVETEKYFDDQFFTLSHLILDPRTGRLEYANAGLPHLKIRKASGAIVTLESSGGYIGDSMVGYRADNSGTTVYRLEPGDSVVLFSDGIADGMDAAGAALASRLDPLLQTAGSGEPDGLLRRLTARIRKRTDDATALIFQWPGPAKGGSPSR